LAKLAAAEQEETDLNRLRNFEKSAYGAGDSDEEIEEVKRIQK
jgi:hypothetical protein